MNRMISNVLRWCAINRERDDAERSGDGRSSDERADGQQATARDDAERSGDGRREQQTTTCQICPHACRLKEGQIGICGARRVVKAQVVSDSYAKLTGLALDPIEKKPLARFHPGSMILSVGSYGCNLNCPFCQNSDIARMRGVDLPTREGDPSAMRRGDPSAMRDDDLPTRVRRMAPKALVDAALSQQSRGNIGIAYTYNEPLVGYEFVLDTARLAHEVGLLNVLVTNGYVNEEPFDTLLAHLDAANIDLKGFTQDVYDRLGAPQGLATVQRSIELAAARIHVEVTTLIVPAINDDVDQIERLAAWLARIDPRIPLHLTRFHPAYRMLDREPTPRATILDLVKVARRHLEFVYPGNI